VFVVMRSIAAHYDRVAAELAVDDADVALPARVHGVVLISKLHKPAMRAIAYARLAGASSLEAVVVDLDPDETAELTRRWDELRVPIPLRVLDSPYREVVRPVMRYVKNRRSQNPRDLITVYIPEYVVGRWWEQALHNQTALRLKARLLFVPGVLVVSVPFQLASAKRVATGDSRPTAGDVRRGIRREERR